MRASHITGDQGHSEVGRNWISGTIHAIMAFLPLSDTTISGTASDRTTTTNATAAGDVVIPHSLTVTAIYYWMLLS